MTLSAVLTKSAQRCPERLAIAHGERPHATYGDLSRRVSAIARALRVDWGLAPGDRVGLAMTNCPAYFEAQFAAWHAGLVAVPINAKLHRNEFRYILDNSGARVCFVTDNLRETISGLVDELPALAGVVCVDDDRYRALLSGDGIDRYPADLSDPAWLFYTSGTTGRPKGATLTHRNLLTMTLSYFADVDAVDERGAMLHPAPLSHGAGLYALSHVAKGAANVIPESGGFDPAEIYALIEAFPEVSFFAAPTMISRLINHPDAERANTANLRTIIYGGGPMYVSDLEQALDLWGPKLAQIYGQGESPMTITALSKAQHAQTDHPHYRDWLASVGFARTDVEIAVVDEDDEPVAEGEVGEIVVRGDVVMRGYWENPRANAAALRGGWLHTGDAGVLHATGYLTLKDRVKDMIISGGTNIYPREIEEVLLRSEAVLEASVVGRRHPEWGEEVVAFVVPRDGAVPRREALDALCLEHIARFKRPREYVFIDSLPKNNYGKVLKTALREQLQPVTESAAVPAKP